MTRPSNAPGSYGHHLAVLRRRRRRVLTRDGIVVLVTVGVVVIAGLFRSAPNPARPPAEIITGQLEAVYRDVRSGELQLSEDAIAVGADVRAARIDPDRWAVAGEVGDTCYAMWWDSTGTRRIRVVPALLACQPEIGGSFEPETVARSAPSADESEATARWDLLLPPAISTQAWWIPLLIVAGGIVLSALVRIIVVLATRGTT